MIARKSTTYNSEHLVNAHSHRVQSSRNTVYQSAIERTEPEGRLHSLGIHPMLKIAETAGFLAEMDSKLANQDCIAIGESGLDKNSCFSTVDQLTLFRAQMELSVKHQLPVIVHCVGRWNELERLFKEKTKASPEWIIHGFRKAKLAQNFLDLGANLSFGKALLYDKHLHKLLPTVPIERIFLETDDEEVEINELYAKLAELKSLPLQTVTERIYANFRRVFYRSAEL